MINNFFYFISNTLIMHYNFLNNKFSFQNFNFQEVPLGVLKCKKVKILHSIISCEYNNHEQFIHCWDGNNFFELTSFEYPIDIIEHCRITNKNLEGMQIIGRSM